MEHAANDKQLSCRQSININESGEMVLINPLMMLISFDVNVNQLFTSNVKISTKGKMIGTFTYRGILLKSCEMILDIHGLYASIKSQSLRLVRQALKSSIARKNQTKIE